MGDLLPTLSLLCCFCCDKKDPDEERYDFEEGVSKRSRIKPISEADERRVCEWRARVPVIASVPRESTVATVPTTSEPTREVMTVQQHRTQVQSQILDQSRNHDRDQSPKQDQTRTHDLDQTQYHGRDRDRNDYDDYDFQFREQDPTDFDFRSRKQTQRQELKVGKENRRCGERSGSERMGGVDYEA